MARCHPRYGDYKVAQGLDLLAAEALRLRLDRMAFRYGDPEECDGEPVDYRQEALEMLEYRAALYPFLEEPDSGSPVCHGWNSTAIWSQFGSQGLVDDESYENDYYDEWTRNRFGSAASALWEEFFTDWCNDDFDDPYDDDPEASDMYCGLGREQVEKYKGDHENDEREELSPDEFHVAGRGVWMDADEPWPERSRKRELPADRWADLGNCWKVRTRDRRQWGRRLAPADWVVPQCSASAQMSEYEADIDAYEAEEEARLRREQREQDEFLEECEYLWLEETLADDDDYEDMVDRMLRYFGGLYPGKDPEYYPDEQASGFQETEFGHEEDRDLYPEWREVFPTWTVEPEPAATDSHDDYASLLVEVIVLMSPVEILLFASMVLGIGIKEEPAAEPNYEEFFRLYLGDAEETGDTPETELR